MNLKSRIMILVMLFLTAFAVMVSCKKEDVTSKEFQFKLKNGLPYIETTINGVGGRLLIDTGANTSVLDIRYRYYYGFVPYESGDHGDGVGGSVKLFYTSKAIVKHNDSVIRHNFMSANLGETFNGTGLVGILGSDYFRKHKIIIDYNSNKLHRIINE